ncbi:MAG TPA: ATPase domain-containing protein [Anaeromyxobacter sp.]|nr:ATPase domain-containing protein [Anaeromyxobacter sp.]
MQRLTTGSRELDAILGGGFPKNAIHILMGAPGTGKTILAEQLCFANASPDRPILYLATFSEPLQKLVGFLQEFSFAKPEKLGAEIVYEYVGEDVLTQLERVPARVQELLALHRPKIIVFDSFKALADLMPDRSAWRRTLDAVGGMLTAYDTTTFWVGEYTAEMMSDLPEFAVADGIVDLTRKERGARDERFLRVLKLRGSGFLAGNHSIRLSGDGIEAFRRFITPAVPPDYRPILERLKTGIAGLDEMVATGWLRGTATLVAGPSGAGKTSVGMHFLKKGVELGEPGLLASFQESPTQLVRMMAHLGWEPEKLLGPARLDHFYTSPVELQIDTIASEIVQRVERNGVKRVVIDAVSDLEKGASDPHRYRDFLYSLTQTLATRNVTSMLLVETAGMFEEHGITGHEVSYMSDSILLLEMLLRDDLTRTIRILKCRGSEHDGRRHTLRITDRGIAVD